MYMYTMYIPHSLLRDTFTVPCAQRVALKLISSCLSCIVKVIDNDSQSVIGTDLAPMRLTPNEKGYTLIGEVWSLDEALDTKDSWSLALLSSSPFMPTLVSSKDGALATSFSVNETKKYYLPNRDYQILRFVHVCTCTAFGIVGHRPLGEQFRLLPRLLPHFF